MTARPTLKIVIETFRERAAWYDHGKTAADVLATSAFDAAADCLEHATRDAERRDAGSAVHAASMVLCSFLVLYDDLTREQHIAEHAGVFAELTMASHLSDKLAGEALDSTPEIVPVHPAGDNLRPKES